MKIKNKPMLITGLITWGIIVFLLAFILLTGGCTPDPKIEYVTLPPIIDDDPPPVNLGVINYLTYDGTSVYFEYDTASVVWKTGQANYVRPGVISVDDILYFLDVSGNVLQSYRLPCVPDAIAINGVDVWSAEIDGADTLIYKNSDLLALYPWEIGQLNVTYTGDIVAYATTGYQYKYFSISGSEEDIAYAAGGGLFVFDLNTIDKTATFRDLYDYHDGWTTNYFWRATGWLLSDTLWISSNGYSWDAGGLYENSTALWTWNLYPYPEQDIYNETPVVIPAAVRTEHGEDVTYWIECNTGYLFRYTPSIDLLETITRIYAGDGLRATGYALQHILRPSVINDRLYYHHAGFLYEYDFNTETAQVMGTDIEIWGIE